MLAGAVVDESPWLFPAALGVLVASKAYGVTRAAAVPRLLPDGPHAWSRPTPGSRWPGIVGAAISAPLAALASTFGAGVVAALRVRACSSVATILAILLPDRVDSTRARRSWR